MRTQNKSKGALKHARKWEVVIWDWKEGTPDKSLAKLDQQFEHSYLTNMGEDNNFAFFSTFPITSDLQARELLVGESLSQYQ